MEEHYIKDVGKITYVYGVNLEEHKTVIEKQQKRIAELEKQLDQLKQELEEINAGYDFTYEQSSGAIKELKQNQTQLAIQKLEKVKDTLKHFCEIHSDEFYGVKSQVKGIEQDVCEEIDNQIKVLKGE